MKSVLQEIKLAQCFELSFDCSLKATEVSMYTFLLLHLPVSFYCWQLDVAILLQKSENIFPCNYF